MTEPAAALGTGWTRSALLGASGLLAGLLETALVLAVVSVAVEAAQGTSPALLGVSGPDERGPLVALVVALGAALVSLHIISARLAVALMRSTYVEVRRALFAAYGRAAWARQSAEESGTLQDLVTTTSGILAAGALQRSNALVAAGQLGTTLAAAVLLTPLAGAAVAVLGASALSAARLAGRRTQQLSRTAAAAEAQVAVAAADLAWLAADYRTAGVQERALTQLDDGVRVAADRTSRVLLRSRLVPVLSRDVVVVVLAIALVLAAGLGSLDLAGLGASAVLLLRAAGHGQQVLSAGVGLGSQRAHAQRVDAALRRWRDAAITPDSGEAPKISARDRAAIHMQAVSHVYPGSSAPALADIDLVLRKGELVGLVGPSGAGKSTLVHVLLGLLVPSGGRVLVADTDVTGGAHGWLGSTAFVPQEPRLLSGTVADNIRFLRQDLSDARLREAAVTAGLTADLASWPQGLDHPVGPAGGLLSGGQRQRIALARALAGRPDVLVLDEPTSALDAHSEDLVRHALDDLRHTTCTIVIAHRLSTLRTCDRILMMSEGRVQADGDLAELLAEDPYLRSVLELSSVLPGPSR